MDPRSNIKKYGIGCLITDCVLILDIVIDIYTKKTTPSELLFQIALCAILTIPVIWLLKRFARKK